MSRKHNATKYDEQNVFAQCVACNKYGHGKQFEFGAFLDYKFGQGTAQRLNQKSKMFCKALGANEIKYYTKLYKEKAQELAKNKGLII